MSDPGWARTLPGAAAAIGVAIVATLSEPVMKAVTGGFSLPAMVLALIIGILLSRLGDLALTRPGIEWCVRKLLRYSIALLGLRVAFADLSALGIDTLVLVAVAMAVTLASGVFFARRLGLSDGYGAISGAANAVCGASAALATSTVVPDYPRKEADIAFTVVMANAASTIVMLAYPLLARWLSYAPGETSVLFGATIHDMAQVVGAGYAVSEPVGNGAVIVKLFRIFLLLPAVMAVGFWFSRQGNREVAAKVPVPVFALVFLALVGLNSLAPGLPGYEAIYLPVRAFLNTLSTWGLLIAISALGLGTSVSSLSSVGWRHMLVFVLSSFVLLACIMLGLSLNEAA